jgi:hypothetical protein
MKMDDIVQVLKECNHGVPKFLCRRCLPRETSKLRGGMSSVDRWGLTQPKKRKIKRYRPSKAVSESN